MTLHPETVDWQSHASLFRSQEQGVLCLARGALRAMVGLAMVNAAALNDLYIETDDGRMFCRQEIAYISLLADPGDVG